jgi:nicotinate-nucleotide adenylyltransferase
MQIALFFGTYNPIHTGHLIIANYVLQYCSLDQLWFVVSPQNPFKDKSKMLSEYDRLHLVELAISDNEHFHSSNVEFNLPKPSYTIDTLTYLSEKYPNHEFTLLMGGDNLRSLHKWKNYETILKYYKIIVYKRKQPITNGLQNHPSVTFLDEVPFLNISSTFIRKLFHEGKSAKYLVPNPVLDYIESMNFYK